jgi:glycosyltransferase involved in cell wall biosynthesis
MDAQLLQPTLWIVLDNSDTPENDWSPAKENPLVYYESVSESKPIGWLRNRCLDLALAQGADYIAFWDDDDYYPPTRLSSGVDALEKNPDAGLSGSSIMYLLLTKENMLLQTGPFHDNHATAATWTIRRSIAETYRFQEDKVRGEEVTFTKNWEIKVAQIPAEQVIVVMGHSRNTVDKSDLAVRPHLYKATVLNDANGRMVMRMKWPVPWDLFRSTFSV